MGYRFYSHVDKLVVMDIDVGDKILNIITGAKNVFEGALVPVAMHGATVYSKNGIQKITALLKMPTRVASPAVVVMISRRVLPSRSVPAMSLLVLSIYT